MFRWPPYFCRTCRHPAEPSQRPSANEPSRMPRRCKHKTRFPHAYPPPSPSTLVPCKTPQAWARLGRGLASLAVAPAAADAVVGQVSAPVPSSTSLESVPLYPNSAHRRPHDPDSHTATQSPTSPPVSLVKIAPSTVHCVQHRRSQGDARGVRYAEASEQARDFAPGACFFGRPAPLRRPDVADGTRCWP